MPPHDARDRRTAASRAARACHVRAAVGDRAPAPDGTPSAPQPRRARSAERGHRRGGVDSGAKWSTVARGGGQGLISAPVARRARGGGAGVPRHLPPAPRREGPAVPAGEVPRRAGRRHGDHQGPGALPLRLPDGRVRQRITEALRDGPGRQPRRSATTAGCFFAGASRRGAGQAGPDHRSRRPARVRRAWTATASSSAPTPGSRSGTPRPGTTYVAEQEQRSPTWREEVLPGICDVRRRQSIRGHDARAQRLHAAPRSPAGGTFPGAGRARRRATGPQAGGPQSASASRPVTGIGPRGPSRQTRPAARTTARSAEQRRSGQRVVDDAAHGGQPGGRVHVPVLLERGRSPARARPAAPPTAPSSSTPPSAWAGTPRRCSRAHPGLR